MVLDVRGMTPLLEVFDMASSLRFYHDVLGFEIVMTDNNTVAPDHNWVWLRLGGADVMLNTAYEYENRPSAPDPLRIRSHQDTCLYFGAPNVDEVYEHLTSRGIDVKKPKIAPYGMKQLYLLDPDGFNLCFQWKAEAANNASA